MGKAEVISCDGKCRGSGKRGRANVDEIQESGLGEQPQTVDDGGMYHYCRQHGHRGRYSVACEVDPGGPQKA